MRWRPSIYWENKRELTLIETEKFGNVVMVEVGATYVGSIVQTFSQKESVSKGEEKGYFCFGGSCVIVIFQSNRISIAEDLAEASRNNVELIGKMGQTLAYAHHECF